MAALSEHYQTVAIDLRGYNLSDKPKGGENYAMLHLLQDVAAVIPHLGQEEAIIVGHDWGGGISWTFLMHQPTRVQRVIILKLPHPHGIAREMAHKTQKQKNSH